VTDTGPLDAHIVERVGALLGTPFTTGARLRGSDRWIVVRGEVADRSVVVKQVRTRRFDFAARTPALHVTGYASERGALEFFADDDDLADRVPALIAADEEFGILVLEDLGVHPSIADILLGDDTALARATLLDYARLLAEFAAHSIPRVDEFDAPRGHATHFAIWQLRDAMSNLALPPAAERQLADIADALETDPGWLTVGSADACPDNVLVTPDGLRLLDFEGAARYHAVFDAGSLALPFPSCWCHDAFADELRRELLDAHRLALGRTRVEYDERLARVSIVWCAWTLARWLEGTRRADFRPIARLASGRERVRAAAQTIATEATGPLRTWAAELDRALRAEWGTATDLRPSYPALA
jgi:thiamine kinase-like enzyme